MKTYEYPPQQMCAECGMALGWDQGQEMSKVAYQGYLRLKHYPPMHTRKACSQAGQTVDIPLIYNDNP